MIDYPTLGATIASLTEGETNDIALMATVACEIHHADTRFGWTGFYRVVSPGLLKVGPYQGGHGCLTIPFGRGVCGAVAQHERTELVADVNTFPGHIACASSTQSELVMPVFDATGTLIAVFDIDSNQPGAFNQSDQVGLELILKNVFVQAEKCTILRKS